MNKLVWYSLVSVLVAMIALASCSTTPPKPSEPVSVSLEQIKERLQMVRHIDDLGFAEKTFDECELGFKNENCEKEYLTIIHFQLLCRESEGTVSAAPETIPVPSNSIKWKLGEVTGTTKTDASGFGKVEGRFRKSMSRSRLRLTIENNFVAVPASETSRIVVPGDWCPR